MGMQKGDQPPADNEKVKIHRTRMHKSTQSTKDADELKLQCPHKERFTANLRIPGVSIATPSPTRQSTTEL